MRFTACYSGPPYISISLGEGQFYHKQKVNEENQPIFIYIEIMLNWEKSYLGWIGKKPFTSLYLCKLIPWIITGKLRIMTI